MILPLIRLGRFFTMFNVLFPVETKLLVWNFPENEELFNVKVLAALNTPSAVVPSAEFSTVTFAILSAILEIVPVQLLNSIFPILPAALLTVSPSKFTDAKFTLLYT